MRYYPMALRAVSGDEAARQWLAEHAFHPEQDMRRTIIACDFDGTLCESDYPAIIRPNEKLIAALRMMKEMGYELILWTCRGCDDLDEAVVWLREQGLNFELVNENSPAIIEYFDFDSRKIFADEYWDDKAAEATVE